MARKRQNRANKPEKKAERKRQVARSQRRRTSRAEDNAKDVTAQPQAPVSKLKHDDGFSILDILDIRKALRYLLSLVEPRIPERYRRKLPILFALAVLLVGLAYTAHRYWYLIVGIPDIRLIANQEPGALFTLPKYVWAEIVRQSGEPVVGHSMEVRVTSTEVWFREIPGADNGSAKTEAGKTIRMRLIHPKQRDLYAHYKQGNYFLILRFFRDSGYTDLIGDLWRIPFSKTGLKTIGLPPLNFYSLDGKHVLERPGISLLFEINKDAADPNDLKSVLRELVNATEPFCWVANREQFRREKERYDAHAKSVAASSGPALPYQRRSLAAKVTIMGWSDSRKRWIFELEDAQRKIEDGRVLVACGSKLTDTTKRMILTKLLEKIVKYYGIVGQIDEVIQPKDKKGKYEARLNIGSYMGVNKGMVFKVLSKGIDPLQCGQVKIEKVPEGIRGAAGELTLGEGRTPNEYNYKTFETCPVEFDREETMKEEGVE